MPEAGEPTAALAVDECVIAGYAQDIRLRLYRPAGEVGRLPGLLCFHGGGFTSGSLEDAEVAAGFLARSVPALVVSVGYSLAPDHPFPAAAQDAYRAACWMAERAGELRLCCPSPGVVGHDAGGHIAASLAFIARDQGGVGIAAQALLGPMLDPSLTRASELRRLDMGPAGAQGGVADYARCYRAYLPQTALRLHPYAAPLESRRLGRLPATLILTAENDLLRPEAETYAAGLIAAGVPTEVTRLGDVTHADLARHEPALSIVSEFFRRRVGPAEYRT